MFLPTILETLLPTTSTGSQVSFVQYSSAQPPTMVDYQYLSVCWLLFWVEREGAGIPSSILKQNLDHYLFVPHPGTQTLIFSLGCYIFLCREWVCPPKWENSPLLVIITPLQVNNNNKKNNKGTFLQNYSLYRHASSPCVRVWKCCPSEVSTRQFWRGGGAFMRTYIFLFTFTSFGGYWYSRPLVLPHVLSLCP